MTLNFWSPCLQRPSPGTTDTGTHTLPRLIYAGLRMGLGVLTVMGGQVTSWATPLSQAPVSVFVFRNGTSAVVSQGFVFQWWPLAFQCVRVYSVAFHNMITQWHVSLKEARLVLCHPSLPVSFPEPPLFAFKPQIWILWLIPPLLWDQPSAGYQMSPVLVFCLLLILWTNWIIRKRGLVLARGWSKIKGHFWW